MLKRTRSILEAACIDANANPALAALVDYAGQRPGLEWGNYGGDGTAYRSELRSIQRAYGRVKAAVAEAGAIGLSDADVIAASKRAFSGRLTWNAERARWDYCTGQYWPTEYRNAVAAVLDVALIEKRRSMPPTSRPVTTIAGLKSLNKQNGGCWFGRGEMAFFGTRIESGILRGRYFVTSEQPPYGPRKYSVRTFDAQGSVDTVGEFCAYTSRADALAAVPK